MKKPSILIISVVALILIVTSIFVILQSNNKDANPTTVLARNITAVFECPNKSIIAIFRLPQDTVDLYLSDGRELILPRAISADGARYANTDESLVFWNKGNTAFIEEGNMTTYQDCVDNSTQN